MLLLRFLTFVLLLLLAGFGRAEGTVSPGTATSWACSVGDGKITGSTPFDACSLAYNRIIGSQDDRTIFSVASCAPIVPGQTVVQCATTQQRCVKDLGCGATAPGPGIQAIGTLGGCPANSSKVGDQCVCASGFSPDSRGASCVSADSCQGKAGKVVTRNYTIGWARTPDGNTSAWSTNIIQQGANLEGASSCDGACVGTLSFSTGVPNAWQSQVPNAQGLYRLSVDLGFTYTGATCNASQIDPATDPKAPSPPCDGYVGQLNLKTVCVGKIGSKDPTYTASTPVRNGNPAAGSDGAGSLAGRQAGGSTGDANGGPVSPRDGDIRGGSGSPIDGSGGTGTSGSGEKPRDPCGLPGTPPCKLDEVGTPTADQGRAGVNAGAVSMESAMDQRAQKLGDVSIGSSSRTVLPWSPSALLLPTAGCSVLTTQTRLGNLVLNACESQLAQLWRQLLGWLLYMLTLVYAWRSLTSATGGK